jgi:hypothetical protein
MARTNVDDIKVGHLLACVNYYEVTEVGEKDLVVKDALSGEVITYGRGLCARECWSADTFSGPELYCCKTDMAKKILAAGDKVFTVAFTKKDGGERILRGHLASLNEEHTVLGMVKVVDLDLQMKDPKAKPFTYHRLVTFQNLMWLIIDGKKYSLKANKRAKN